MRTPKLFAAHGGAYRVYEYLRYNLAYCHDGFILRDNGAGWNEWMRPKRAEGAGERIRKFADVRSESQQAAISRAPELQAFWKEIKGITGQSLSKRVKLMKILDEFRNDPERCQFMLETKHGAMGITPDGARSLCERYHSWWAEHAEKFRATTQESQPVETENEQTTEGVRL